MQEKESIDKIKEYVNPVLQLKFFKVHPGC